MDQRVLEDVVPRRSLLTLIPSPQVTEARLAAIVATSAEGITSQDLDGTVRTWNRGAEQMYGYPAAEMVGRPITTIVPAERQDELRGLLAAVAAGESVVAFETIRVRRDGSRLPVALTLSPIRTRTEQIFGVSAIERDISRQKEDEEALRIANARLEARVGERTAALEEANSSLRAANLQLEAVNAELQQQLERRATVETALAAQKALLEAVLEEAADPIIVVDAGAAITLMNSAARRLYGTEPVGTPLKTVLEPLGTVFDSEGRPLPFEARVLPRVLRGETVIRQHESVVRADGRRTDYLISAAPVRDPGGGDLLGAVAVIMDITAEKETETRLRAALADREAALATNKTLLRDVHHRVKNNLQMLCDLLYLQMEAVPDPQHAGVLRETYGRIYAIARLHEQLYQAMQRGEVNIPEYLARLLDGIQGLYPDVPIRFRGRDERLSLDLDRAIHVGLIVTELVTNALKHGFGGARSGEVEVRIRRLGDRIELQVQDNGAGLPAEFNVAGSRTLGLRVVHILSKRLEARIRVESRGGALFSLDFPLRSEPPIEPRQE
jgi:PAS domain S-box-containing protein